VSKEKVFIIREMSSIKMSHIIIMII